MKRLINLTLIMLLVSISNTFGQEKQRGFTVFGSVPFISNDFKKFDFQDPWIGIGVDYDKPINEYGVILTTSAALLARNIDPEEVLYSWFDDQPHFERTYHSNFYNLYLLSGLKEQGKISTMFKGYSSIQAGIRIFFPPGFTDTLPDSYFASVRKGSFNSAVAFGFGLGGGLVFQNKYNLGFRLYLFPTVKAKGRLKYDNLADNRIHYSPEPLTLSFRFGIQL
ncbi:hypothetical protein ACFL7D_07640 [candidate division KSB1 bacterium]